MTEAEKTIQERSAGIPDVSDGSADSDRSAHSDRSAGILAGRLAGFQPAVNEIRDALASLAPLFVYPDADYFTKVAEARSRKPSPDLTSFAAEIATLDIAELQSLYTSTFDLAPSCSPYLGIHLFGEEGRERARLMIGLRLDYRRGGEERDGELPDHIAELLRFAPKFPDDVWADLVALVLVPALAKMSDLLRASNNPYRHLIAAALAFSREWSAVAAVRASQPEEQGDHQ